MIRIDLLRHGALEGGVKYRGRTDDPLTDAGRAAMDAVWARLRDEIDIVVTSPLSRCAGPARAWAEEAGIECVVEPRVAEMDYGAWEGLTAAQIEARFPGWLARWRRDPAGMRIPDAETVEALAARVDEFRRGLCAAYDGARALVVSHSGPVRMLLARALGAPIATTRRMEIPYASWSRVTHDAGRELVRFINRLPAP